MRLFNRLDSYPVFKSKLFIFLLYDLQNCTDTIIIFRLTFCGNSEQSAAQFFQATTPLKTVFIMQCLRLINSYPQYSSKAYVNPVITSFGRPPVDWNLLAWIFVTALCSDADKLFLILYPSCINIRLGFQDFEGCKNFNSV